MVKLFHVAEDKLAALLDKVLKVGGLAVHKEVTDLIGSLKEANPPAAPAEPSAPSVPPVGTDGSPSP